MNTVPEEVAFAHLVVQLPADRRVRFGGTRLVRERRAGGDIIRNMVQGLQPIQQKRESEEIALLKKIVAMSQQKQAPQGTNFGARQTKTV